jgi:hypothetical protein
MLIRVLPLVTGLLPIIAIHISLVVAINAGTVPSCFPYIEGCTSISATGRHEPASLIFKPAMMSSWGILVFYWLFNLAWLRSLARTSGQNTNIGAWMAGVGTVGALALILYTTFLGTEAPFYEFMRRVGIYFYFGCTVIAQIILARHTLGLSRRLALETTRRVGQVQITLALIPFVLGILNLVLKATLENPDPVENIIEWIFALLMQSYFLLTYLAWRETAFSGRFEVVIRNG